MITLAKGHLIKTKTENFTLRFTFPKGIYNAILMMYIYKDDYGSCT